jgi:hypothetical protein
MLRTVLYVEYTFLVPVYLRVGMHEQYFLCVLSEISLELESLKFGWLKEVNHDDVIYSTVGQQFLLRIKLSPLCFHLSEEQQETFCVAYLFKTRDGVHEQLKNRLLWLLNNWKFMNS